MTSEATRLLAIERDLDHLRDLLRDLSKMPDKLAGTPEYEALVAKIRAIADHVKQL
jgi:hypothetical protein